MCVWVLGRLVAIPLRDIKEGTRDEGCNCFGAIFVLWVHPVTSDDGPRFHDVAIRSGLVVIHSKLFKDAQCYWNEVMVVLVYFILYNTLSKKS